MNRRSLHSALVGAAMLLPAAVAAQSDSIRVGTARSDTLIERILRLGSDSSDVERLAQRLLDSIGPRLTGSVRQRQASDWLVATYRSWGIEARNEAYGTWRGWRRGISHLDLIAPRVRSLEALLVGDSPGTNASRPAGRRAGRPGVPRDVEARVVALPTAPDSASFIRALPSVRGAFVLLDEPEVSCRPVSSWREHARPTTLRALADEARRRDSLERARLAMSGGRSSLSRLLEQAGAAGMLTSQWTGAPGTIRVYTTRAERIPTFAVGCEDYSLLARLAANGQGPRLRARADAELLGEVPVANTIARIDGTGKAGEYVMLSAHFDSYDGASGATDNGTGTVIIMEAMRLLKTLGHAPKRTILAGHWVGEEHGLIGSRAYAADHPEILRGLSVVLNHDAGTGRVERIGMNGFARAEGWWRRWLAELPAPYNDIRLEGPGLPSTGSSDHSAFVCHGVPGFFLSSVSYDYGLYTWHTNRDTYDKIDFADLRHNAALIAAVAWLAANDEEPMPRDQAPLGVDSRTGQPRSWPECPAPVRRSQDSGR